MIGFCERVLRFKRGIKREKFVTEPFNPLIADLAARLKAKGMAPKAIIVAAMHKLIHLIYGVLKTCHPFQPAWAKSALVSPLVTAVLFRQSDLISMPWSLLVS